MKTSLQTVNISPSYITSPKTETEPPCWALPVSTRHNSWANRGSASALHSSEDTSFHRALYPSGDRSELPPLTEMDTGGPGSWQCGQEWHQQPGIWAADMGTMCANGGQCGVMSSVDVSGNRSESKTKSKKASGSLWREEKNLSKYDSANIFCWYSTFQPKWCLTARNAILIYYLMSQPQAMGAIMHYELQWVSRPWATETVDHSSQGMTSRSHEDIAVEMRLMLLSAVARGRETVKQRSKGEKMKKETQNISLLFPLIPNSNGVVFKTFITNLLLLIFQQQGLKLCALFNLEPVASGSNQSNLLTAFRWGGWSQTLYYCTSQSFPMCAISESSKMVICEVRL